MLFCVFFKIYIPGSYPKPNKVDPLEFISVICILIEGFARISWPRGKPIFCHKVKSRNDLILTKHLPLGLGNRESVTLCFKTDWQMKRWPQGSSRAARWYLQQGESWILRRKVSFYPTLLGKGEHSKMVEFFPLLLFNLQVVSSCL